MIKTRDLNERFVYFLGLNGHRPPNIGESIPDFSVTDIQGRTITRDDLNGRRTLVAFTSPTCGHCGKLMGEIRDWEPRRGPGDPEIMIFTDGTEETETKHGITAPVIIDENHRTSAKFGMRGVPSAVLLDETGTIVTEAAIGSKNIWALIGGRK